MPNDILDFLNDEAWDRPFFKVLANNDTGAAVGHQGGIVVPKDLRAFFPILDESATSSKVPTTDRLIRAELFLVTALQASVSTRYQFQTWGGTRPAESRLTDNLSVLRNKSSGGDILVMQRKADDFDCYRLCLLPKNTAAFLAVLPLVKDRRWGALDLARIPVTQDAIASIRNEIVGHTGSKFEVVLPAVKRVTVVTNRAVRDVLFRKLVRAEYDNRCALSGLAIRSPKDAVEVEAAHVVPLPCGGSDDVRNGLALCQTIHWAFDRGLIGIEPASRKVYVPKQTRSILENGFLSSLTGRKLLEALSQDRRVHAEALAWHWETLVKQWD